jgi:hypothetical protein
LESDENVEKNNWGGGSVYLIGFVIAVLGLALAFNAYSFFNKPSTTSTSSIIQTASSPASSSSNSYSQSMAAMHQGQSGIAQQVGSCGA